MAREGASSRGYHFIDEYRTCPRKWFLHRIAGYEALAKKPALEIGKILHLGQELLLEGDALELVHEKLDAELEKVRFAWFEEEDFTNDRSIIHGALNEWHRTFFASDNTQYDLVGVELELEAELPDRTRMTGRVDRLYKERDLGDSYIIMDTKTTKWSIDSVFQSMDFGDQATCYSWLVKEKYGTGASVEVMPDVLMLKGKPKAARPGVIRRSQSEIDLFLESMMGTWSELRSKVRAYESTKLPEAYLFPRAPTACQLFGCDYADICRKRIDETTGPLPDFTQTNKLCIDELEKLR